MDTSSGVSIPAKKPQLLESLALQLPLLALSGLNPEIIRQ